ncbi:MAG: hypothetical protein J7525_19590 [Roseofilum sp. SID3]|uniref:hypothetical protein n=1 Tax=Roseofilum sp. SID3 TaxID=2821499 RepID=UPI001B2D2D24|nr:hypothetical protein [Roseofilum sp. SID3]MBP0015299.1 hypothetical protein [Roseofilum sp. SID3]
MVYTPFHTPQDLSRGLSKVGLFECPECSRVKYHFHKKPIELKKDIIDKPIKCFCCRDTGSISGYLIRKYGILPDYSNSNPAVVCSNCNAGEATREYCWDLATKEECREIHLQERDSCVGVSASGHEQPDPQKVKEVVQEYITGLEMPESKPDPYDQDYPEEHYAV